MKSVINDVRMLQFREFGDERGHLVVAEGGTRVLLI